MLILALVAWLAASPPDAVTRIPGTEFRLGMTENQLQDPGAFPEVKISDAAGTTPRQGDAKFFGIPCRATLYFRDGRLARARFQVKEIALHAVDYIEGQLRRSKMSRQCLRVEPRDYVCDWLGEVKIHLEIQKDGLDARVEPPPRPREAEADSARAAAATAASGRDTVRTPAPVADRVRPDSARAAAATPSSPAPAPSAPAVPEGPAELVATLPETLRLSLPERNSPSDWPRLTFAPKLVYPEAAGRESVQGIVWVLALVDTDGVVRSAQVDRGIRELNDAAVAWVSKARFAPCVRDGRLYRFWVAVAVRFTLY
jgi:TonB family protein